MFSKNSLTTLGSLLVVLMCIACSNFHRLQKSKDWHLKYTGAMKYYQAKKYFKAGQLLEEIVPLTKGNHEAAPAEFYLAYCKFHQKEFLLSAYHFKNFYETYPRDSLVEEAMYKRGELLYSLSPAVGLDQEITYEAIEALQLYRQKYPYGAYRAEVDGYYKVLQKKLMQKAYNSAKLYHQIGYYQAAIKALECFEQDYPEEELTAAAAYWKIEAQYILAKGNQAQQRSGTWYTTIEYCHDFFDNYAASEYIQKVEKIYQESLLQIHKITKCTN